MTLRLSIALTTCLALIACGDRVNVNRYLFEGQNYRHSSKGVDGRQDTAFVTTVSPLSKGLAGARQAAEYSAVKYCITTRGTSDISWSAAPDAEEGALNIDNDSVSFAGRCIE